MEQPHEVRMMSHAVEHQLMHTRVKTIINTLSLQSHPTQIVLDKGFFI